MNPHVSRNIIVNDIGSNEIKVTTIPVECKKTNPHGIPGSIEMQEVITMLKEKGFPEVEITEVGSTGYLDRFTGDEISGVGVDVHGRMFFQVTMNLNDGKKIEAVMVRVFERYVSSTRGPLVSNQLGGDWDLFSGAISFEEWTKFISLLKGDIEIYTHPFDSTLSISLK